MALFRQLLPKDESRVRELISSRPLDRLIGVSWTAKKIMESLSSTESLGLFESDLRALVLYKNLGLEIEVFLIFSKLGATGAGEKILKHLIAAHGQAREVWLEVHEDNLAAISFYESQGFVSGALRAAYYPDGKRAINYTLILPSK